MYICNMKPIRLFIVGYRLAGIRHEGIVASVRSAFVYVVRNWKRPVEDFGKSFGD